MPAYEVHSRDLILHLGRASQSDESNSRKQNICGTQAGVTVATPVMYGKLVLRPGPDHAAAVQGQRHADCGANCRVHRKAFVKQSWRAILRAHRRHA